MKTVISTTWFNAARKVLSLFMALCLVAGLAPVPSAFADASGTEAAASSEEESSSSEEVTDLTEAWRAGAIEITQGGTYVLSDDVETQGSLSIAAPKGETVTVDFKGHSVAVSGSEAVGIDVSNSLGSVKIIGAEGDKRGSLSVAGKKVDGAVCAILANYAKADDHGKGLEASPLSISGLDVSSKVETIAKDAKSETFDSYGLYCSYEDEKDKRTSVDASISDCSISSAVMVDGDVADDEKALSEKEAGVAYGVYTDAAMVSIDGNFSCTAESPNVDCCLYSTVDQAFAFGKDFEPDGQLSVYSNGNKDGSAFAKLDSHLELNQQQIANFTDATGNGMKCALNGKTLVLQQPDEPVKETEEAEKEEPSTQSNGLSEGEEGISLLSSDEGSKSVKGSGTDLATALGALSVTNNSVSLPAGSYVLNSDFTWANEIKLDGKGSYSIDLNGHSLTLGAKGTDLYSLNEYAQIRVQNGSSLTLTDSSSSRSGQVVSLNTSKPAIQAFANASMTIDGVSIVKGYGLESVSDGGFDGSNISAVTYSNPAVKIQSGANSIAISNSSVAVDYSTVRKSYQKFDSGYVAALTIEGTPASFVASGTSFKANASREATLSNKNSDAKGSMGGNGIGAVGVYLSGQGSNKTLAFNGCSFTSTSYKDQAYGIYQSSKSSQVKAALNNVQFTSATSASDYAVGLYWGNYANSVTLGGTMKFSGSAASPQYCAALRSTAVGSNASAFVLASDFAASRLPVLIGADVESANATGSAIATYAGISGDVASFFTNATGNKANVVSAENGVVKFVLDEREAQVELLDAGGSTLNCYATFSDAVSAAKSGNTIKLREAFDSDSLSIGQSTEEVATEDNKDSLSYIVDLNGRSISSVSCASSATWTVKSSSDVAPLTGVEQFTQNRAAAVMQSGSGILQLEGLAVSVEGYNRDTYGVYASNGTVALQDCSVYVKAASSKAYGLYANGANISLSGTDVTVVQNTSNIACGIQCASAGASGKGSVSIDALSSVSVAGIGSSMYGVFLAGNDSAPASGAISSSMVSVNVEKESTGSKAFAVHASTATVSLQNGASLASTAEDGVDTSSSEFWCLYGTNAKTQFQLSDICCFQSAANTHIRHVGSPLLFGSSFTALDGANPTNADFKLTVQSDSLTDGQTFGKALDPDAELTVSPDLFKALGLYEGWDAMQSAGALAWHKDGVGAAVVHDGDTSTYATLEAALSNAQEGDTVNVLSDLSAGALSISKSLTVNLNGHAVSVENASGYALKLSGSGSTVLKIADNGNGSLALNGSSGGADIADGAKLVLSGCTVQAPTVGVHTTKGSVSLESATLQVSSAQNATGKVTGIIADGAGSVSVDSGSAITVANSGTFQLVNDDFVRDSLNGSIDSSGAYLTVRKLQLDESEALYQTITKQFQVQASYDKGNDLGLAGVYCAKKMKIDSDGDGSADMIVTAFSNQLGEDEIGKLSSIKPAVIYEYCSYQAAPDAVGISASRGAAVQVDVAGTVSATSQNGNAYALQPSGSSASTWTADSATLNATTQGTQEYQKNTEVSPMLADVVTLKDPSSTVTVNDFFDSGSTQVVVQALPEAGAIAMGKGSASVALKGANNAFSATAAAEGADAFEVAADSVTLQGDFGLAASDEGQNPLRMKTASGYAQAGETFAVAADGATLTSETAALFADVKESVVSTVDSTGKKLMWGSGLYTVQFVDNYSRVLQSTENVKKGDVLEVPSGSSISKTDSNDCTYEFIGWSTQQNATEPEIAKDESSFTFAIASDASTVTYYPVFKATYKKVNLTFNFAYDQKGKKLEAYRCAVDSGVALGQQSLSIPAAQSYKDALTGTTYEFVGWSDGTYTYDPNGLLEMSFSASSNASGVTFTAVYVPVTSGQQLVKFKVDERIYGVAVDAGQIPVYPQQTTDYTRTPELESTDLHYEEDSLITFNGWSDSADTGLFGKGTTELRAAIAGAAPVTYYACFTKSDATVSTITMAAKDSTNNWKYLGDSSTNRVSYKQGQTFKEARLSSSNGTVLDSFTYEGYRYDFLGWSTRKNDKEAVYKDTDVIPTSIKSSSLDISTVFAIYGKTELTYNVTFELDGKKYVVKDQKATTTYGDLLKAAAAQYPALASPSSSSGTFKGWYSKANSSSAFNNEALSLYSLVNTVGGDSLTLYPVFGSSSQTSDLDAVKNQALAQLVSALSKYNKDDYEDYEGTILAAYDDAVNNIRNATSAGAVTQALEDGIAAMDAVQTISGLKSAKADALESLSKAYSGYSKSKYSAKNWKALVAAYEAAKKAIKSSTTSKAAAAAANAGISAMAGVKTKAQAASGSSGLKSSSGSNGLSSGGSSGLRASSKSSLSSAKSSGLKASSSKAKLSSDADGLDDSDGLEALDEENLEQVDWDDATSSDTDTKSTSWKRVIVVLVLILLLIGVLGALIWWLMRRRNSSMYANDDLSSYDELEEDFLRETAPMEGSEIDF